MIKIAYIALAMATLGAYFSVKDFLAWPEQRDIIVSNLSVSYVLALGIVGSLSPWLTKKLWPKAPKWAFMFVAIILGVTIVGILKLLGEPMKWG